MVIRLSFAATALLLLLTGRAKRDKRLMVPDEMRRMPARPGEWRDANSTPREYRYVIRMAENGRVWEMELPEGAGGYEMRIPLGDGTPAGEMLTPADVELLGVAPNASAPEAASPAPDAPSAATESTVIPAAGSIAPAPQPKRSYLTALAKINELYRERRYELALIETVALEKEYPDEARIHAMKGSLYVKLGRFELARAAWTRALELNPNDAGVAEALRSIADREG